MRKIAMCCLAVLLTAAVGCSTTNNTSEQATLAKRTKLAATLPFGVSVGGCKAECFNEICAKVAKPVAGNAEIAIDLPKNQSAIITIFPCDADGVALPGKRPATIIVNGGGKTSLAKANGKKKLAKGFHLMDVVSGGKKAYVLFEIKQ